MNFRKIFKIAKREYLAAVRTKGFLIGLAVAPLFMGGSVIVMAIYESRADTDNKRIAVVDHSGQVTDALFDAAEIRNTKYISDDEGKQVRPKYLLETVEPETDDLRAQRLELSNRVRSGELHAFVEIGPDVLYPGGDPEGHRISYYAKNASIDEVRGWFASPINNHLRRLRMSEYGVDDSTANNVLAWWNVEGLGLVTYDERSGDIKDARRISKVEAIGLPAGMTILVYMMVLMGSLPLLSSVMEEKTQRIAEVLLGLVNPTEFMAGKVIGSVAVSLTSAAVYVVAGVGAAYYTGVAEHAPMDVIPWFFVYMLLAVVMFGSVNAAIGSVCNDPKDAQNLTFPAMVPIIVPLFVMFPVAKEPLSSFSTILSLIPPFVPTLMISRLSSPVDIPTWQPIAGLIGLILFTIAAIWAGGRVFRIAILMQGSLPKFSNIVRWAIKG